VLLQEQGLSLEEVTTVLQKRMQKPAKSVEKPS